MTLAASVEPPTPAVRPHPRRWAGLAVLSVSLLLVLMDMTILNIALPAISADLRPDSVQLLWMVDVYALVLSGLLVTVSALGDRWGRKRTLISGFAVFGLASTSALWADSAGEVIAVRALLGVGGAMIMPATLSMIRALFTDPRERATALGIWAAMAALGGALGPILGGVLLAHFSWHAAFLVNVPVMAVAIIAGLLLLPESGNPRPGRWDLLAALLSMVGMVAFVHSIKHFAKEGLTDTDTLATFALAVLALVWLVQRCLNRPDPLLEIRLFRSRPFTAGAVVAVTTAMAMAAMMLLIAQWMQLVEGFSPLQAGLRLLPAALGAGVVSPLAPQLAARWGARPVLAGGLAVSGGGFLLIALAPTTYPWVALSLLLIGAGMGSLAIASAVIMAGAPAEKSGSAAAIEETGYELGSVLGVSVLGSIAAATYRGGLSLTDLAADGVTGAAAQTVRESLAGALAFARHAGPAAGELAHRARQSFTDSLGVVGLSGAGLMLLAALAVWALTPKHLDISEGHH
ncbi:MFS transporter [Streptomyces sp. NPDC006208]|uniref:MFS transporter n=1 Tax=Streptomyces sp. NPDC006208 TaxID=3156734 RepID=UPI0033AD31D9